MNVIAIFTVLEDDEIVATFDSYCLAVEHIDKHAVHGRKYQVVKVFVTTEESPTTVAETGWKEEYRGMWADVDGYDNPNLIIGIDIDNEIQMLNSQHSVMAWAEPKPVHPRYDLAPVSLTPHPAYLETVEDYEGAPAHTVITCSWESTCPDLVKNSIGEWVSVGEYFFDSSTNLAGARRKVLYWPEEEE